MNSIKDRIFTFLQDNNLSASEFADKIGVQRSSISHILSERNKPSIDFFQKMLAVYPHVDAHWLLTGKKTTEASQNIQASLFDQVNVVKSKNEEKQISSDENKEKKHLVTKEVIQIVTFYNDSTFSIYTPSTKE